VPPNAPRLRRLPFGAISSPTALAGVAASMAGLVMALVVNVELAVAVNGRPAKLPAAEARWKLSSNPFVPPMMPSGPAGFTNCGLATKLW